jgi:hypothetical protein
LDTVRRPSQQQLHSSRLREKLDGQAGRAGAMKKRKLLQKLLSGSGNIRFSEAVSCAQAFGFRLSRIAGGHHIFVHPDVPELVNLQNVAGQAKPYQVKQLLEIIERYDLRLEDEEE